MRARPLRFLGKVSYCVYLIHQAILGVAMSTLGDMRPDAGPVWQWATSALAIVVILAVAQLSWVYFESRLIPLGHRVKYSLPPKVEVLPPPVIAASASEESLAS